MFKKLIFILLLSGFLGCTTSGDPRNSGIFWSEDKNKQRLAEKQRALTATENEGRQATAASMQLDKERAAATAKVSQQKQQLDALNVKLAAMERDMNQIETATARKQQDKEDALKKLDELKKLVNMTDKDVRLSIIQKEKQIEMLEKEIEGLLIIISNL